MIDPKHRNKERCKQAPTARKPKPTAGWFWAGMDGNVEAAAMYAMKNKNKHKRKGKRK